MIKVTLTNEILKRISEIDEKRFSLSTIEMTPVIKNRLRKNSKKKSSYASNKIEGNPLTEKQANEAIDSDPHKHFLKPEQEVRNYFLALNFLEEKLKKKEAFSKEMILEVQAMVEKGASKEKIGFFHILTSKRWLTNPTNAKMESTKNRTVKTKSLFRFILIKRTNHCVAIMLKYITHGL